MVSLIKLSVSTAAKYLNMGKFFYAVNKGWKTGIFDTWAECQANVVKFPNARFKKFATIEEAQNFVEHGSPDVISSQFKPVLQPKQNVIHHPTPRGAESTAGSNSLSADGVIHHCPCCPVGQALRIAEAVKQVREEVDGEPSKKRKRATHPKGSKRSKTAPVPQRSLSSAAANSLPQVEVYTDGACTHNGRRGARAGVGVHWVDRSFNDISARLAGKQTNQRAELTAAIRAIEQADKRGVPRLKLYTDSKYTINCVTDWIQKWKQNGWKTATGKEVLNKDDIVQLSNLCEKVDVEWVYVPGHSNIPGNEAADSLARKGAAKPL